ncbi:HlyD family secretion protein [Luteimonas aquatica]|uniref:HlyD family secretion protein n=1 Tax=Luteimonas aquatica TaxID=450364 RepID=UPI001F592C70|nr:HlyD family efflux transporter periplasmic adaptor subunit [Luteimonas aquatica]
MPRIAAAALLTLALVACADDAPQALGTLEYDRVTLPAPASERIARIDVREGERVRAGQPLMQLELALTQSQLAAAQAQALQARERLRELKAGPRNEDIAQARANLAAAQAQARDAQAYYARLQPLGRQRLVAAADVDRARANAGNTRAQVQAAQAALLELERGTRDEQIAQGESALAAAEAQARAQAVTLGKLDLLAPREGRIDTIPYKLGDQAPLGAPLVVMLVGATPYARVYVPEPIRAGVRVGQAARVFVDGREGALAGRVRMIRSDPSFTPYYALSGEDASRLSWLAEIELDKSAGELPPGLPVRVEFAADAAR